MRRSRLAGRLAGALSGRFRSSPESRAPRTLTGSAAITFACLAGLLAGCQGRGIAVGGPGSVQSAGVGGRAGVLDVDLATAVYQMSPDGDLVIVASDRSVDELLTDGLVRGQVLIIDLLWSPRAGSTPMDASATNASIRHAIAVDGALGHYAGAGFLNLRGEPGNGAVTISIADSSLRLVAASDRFSDPLSPTRLTASITAREDAGAVSRLRSLVRSTRPAAVPEPEPLPAPAELLGPLPASG